MRSNAQALDGRSALKSYLTWVKGVMVVVALLVAACSDDAAGPIDPVRVGTVTLTPPTGQLEIGGGMNLTAVVRSPQGDTIRGRVLTWKSSDTTVAKVSATGVVTAVGSGIAIISAETGGQVGRTTVTVLATVPVPSIGNFAPETAAAGGPGFVLVIEGTGFLPESRVHWNGAYRPTQRVSATELHATISPHDIAQAGTARVQVINALPGGGPSNEIMFIITIQNNPVARVDINVEIALSYVGQPVPLTATPRDGAGNVATGRLITWASSNQLVATVNGNGVVSSVGEGEATITATSEGKTVTTALTVTQRPYNLVYDEGGTTLSVLDTRLGDTRVFWQHAAGMKASHVSVSPDRRWYAYVLDLGGRTDIAMLDIVTRTYHWITNDGVSDQPEWSPNGDRIAFRSARAGRADIWTMAPDGSGAVRVTAAMPAHLAAEHPTWSWNGAMLAFSAGSTAGDRFLYRINVDGSQPVRIESGGGIATEPSWRGDFIAFTRKDPNGTQDIWRVSLSGQAPLVRLTTSGTASAPSWSPDGRWIAFSDLGPAGEGAIRAVRPYGDETRTLIRSQGAANGLRNPSWVLRP